MITLFNTGISSSLFSIFGINLILFNASIIVLLINSFNSSNFPNLISCLVGCILTSVNDVSTSILSITIGYLSSGF